MTFTREQTRAPRRRKNRKGRPRKWGFTWCTKPMLMSFLQQGLRPRAIAKQITENTQGRVKVSHSMVHRAIHALMIDDYRTILLQGNWKPASFEIAPVPIHAPVDVMGVLTTVLDDALEIREYLRTDQGQSINWKTRVGIMFDTIKARLDWADSFVRNRSKLLELVSFDTWLNEMFAIIDEATICTGCGLDLKLKDRIRDRIYQKLMGSGVHRSPGPNIYNTTATHEEGEEEPSAASHPLRESAEPVKQSHP